MSTLNDTEFNDTNSSNKKIILITIAGFLIGTVIGGVGVAFLFRNTLRFQVPNPEEINQLKLSNRQQSTQITKVNILIPKELVTKEYYQLLNSIVDGINTIAVENNEILLPLMNSVKEKSVRRDFSNILNEIFDIRDEIKKINTILFLVQKDINSLDVVNNKDNINETVREYTTTIIGSADTLTDAYANYIQTLSIIFSGPVPTQELLDKLTGDMLLLTKANTKFKSDINSLLKAISREKKI